ncbi:MAG: MFS transporter [Jaaginema sp. PMC 1079.18]|nr:MFS transporter [Jaaginema sp. PMC 1080.18]MEC4851675.1 MFS transporter [Jaaginema sp. PMC 1079.18]MEC4868097.1 MFS transporter [Jaaginema sp. PMC 1078.18]
MTENPAWQQNLIKLYCLKGLSFAWFPIPTIMLFYQANGLSIEDGLLLKTILSASLFVFEIPSGYFADRLGRKVSLIVGGGIWTIAVTLYCFGGSFTAFAVAEILTGFAGSLISGADTALGFDSLVQLGQEAHYRQFEGRLGAVAGITEAVCGIIGAMAAAVNLVYPFILQVIALFFYFLITTTLVEPPRQIVVGQQWQKLGEILQLALIRHKAIQALIIFMAICTNVTFLMVWLSQEYLARVDFPTASFGIAWAFFHGVMSLVSLGAASWENRLGRKAAFLTIVLILGLAYLGLGLTQAQWGILWIAAVYGGRGLKMPLILNALNSYVGSDIRATVLSINSFVFRLGFVGVGTTAGWLTQSLGLQQTFLIFGGLVLGLGSWSWWRLQRVGVFAVEV